MKDPYMWHLPGGFKMSKPQSIVEVAMVLALVAIIVIVLAA